MPPGYGHAPPSSRQRCRRRFAGFSRRQYAGLRSASRRHRFPPDSIQPADATPAAFSFAAADYDAAPFAATTLFASRHIIDIS